MLMQGNRSKLRSHAYTLLLIGVLFVLFVAMSAASPFFFNVKNMSNLLSQNATYLILAVGMTFVISAGEIDLSVGSIVGFSGMVLGMLCQAGCPQVLALVLGILTGALLGTVNGLVVAFGKINSFIVTLGTMTILRGIVLIATNAKSIFGFGSIIAAIGGARFGIFSVPVIISLTVAVLGMVFLHWTKFGTYVLFLGTNPKALGRSGVSVKKYQVLTFALSGLCAGLAGVIIAARLNSAEPLAGQGYEMEAIAAAILGGTSIKGGKGSIVGTIVACFIISVSENGLQLLSISTHYQEIFTGTIMILAVLLSQRRDVKDRE